LTLYILHIMAIRRKKHINAIVITNLFNKFANLENNRVPTHDSGC